MKTRKPNHPAHWLDAVQKPGSMIVTNAEALAVLVGQTAWVSRNLSRHGPISLPAFVADLSEVMHASDAEIAKGALTDEQVKAILKCRKTLGELLK